MSKHLLVAVDSLEDARAATDAIANVCEPGDECILLAVLDEPEAELTGGAPTHVMPEPYTGAGGSEGPRAPNDAPVFVPREELREMRSRDIAESLDRMTQPLRDNGLQVRAETVFSEASAQAVIDYAGDVGAEIMVTRHFRETLEEEGKDEQLAVMLPVLPGT